ncbi:MAG TPA: polysaccharide deacetylase family protein [Thermoanaerobaculia bacterium]|nr:polysaccharide deacetylase family protein [Thermoanaerobaculia bacterium]
MRRVILAFAAAAPVALVLLWTRAPFAGLAVLALSHALLLYPTLSPNAKWLGPVATHFTTSRRDVWLTIDDGPTDDTEAILDLLDEHGVKATFFVKGALVRAYPDRARAIAARGHTIGNHSETHPSATFWCLPPVSIAREIDAAAGAIEDATGATTRWFRAPVGMKNPFVHPHLAARGLRLTGWSVRALDGVNTDIDAVAHRVIAGVHPGAIIAMHQGRLAGGRNAGSLACLTRVVAELKSLGYTFVIPDDEQVQ